MTVELEEVAPNRWRIKRNSPPPKRSGLSLPYVISDSMEPTEQVDGKFYTSKRAFRATGRALGLVEVGTEKFKPKARTSTNIENVEKRRSTIRKAVEQVKAGVRTHSP